MENKNLKWLKYHEIKKIQYTLDTINGTILLNTFWNIHLPQ